ncbi:MAG: hypothetical protein ACJASX_003145 [Limisphaerales bacterium]|jgi:hypothetical protein
MRLKTTSYGAFNRIDMAGGGVKGGIAHGEMDEIGHREAYNPVCRMFTGPRSVKFWHEIGVSAGFGEADRISQLPQIRTCIPPVR